MQSANNARITLELEAGADPIRGRIDRADGSRVCFWGWLELIEELRRVAAGAVEPPSEPSQANSGPAPEPDARARRQPHTATEEQPSAPSTNPASSIEPPPSNPRPAKAA